MIVTLVSRDLILHSAAKVRALLLETYNEIIPALYITDLEKGLLPALITLSTDVAYPVKRATVAPLGKLATVLEDEKQLDTISKQITELIKNADHATMCEVARVFAATVPATTGFFRDRCILPGLIKLTDSNSQNQKTTQRSELAKLLFDTYRSFNGCVIGQNTITRFIVPGLKLLQGDAAYLDPNYKVCPASEEPHAS